MKVCNTQGKIFNEAARSYIDLNDGEVWCPECKGRGCHDSDKIGNYDVVAQCKKCNGRGKLDWVERIVGKKEPFDFDTYYASELADEMRRAIDQEILEDLLKATSNKK